MLVLGRPTPKPIPQPPSPSPQSQLQQQTPRPVTLDQTRIESDTISLRPLGRTGSGLSISSPPITSPLLNKERDLSVYPKPDRYVPPHPRPGYLCKEKPGREFQKLPAATRSREFVGYRQEQIGYGKKGSRNLEVNMRGMRRGVGSDLLEINRPGSSGSWPSSSG